MLALMASAGGHAASTRRCLEKEVSQPMTIYFICRGNETVESFTSYIKAYSRCKMLNEKHGTNEFKVEKLRLF